MKLYSAYDKKALSYSPLMCFVDEISAIRTFESAVHDSASIISRYPADFVLVYLGEMDERTGKITTLDVPNMVLEAAAVAGLYNAPAPVGEQGAAEVSE